MKTLSPVTIVGFGLFCKGKLIFVAGDTRFESRGKVWSNCVRTGLNGNFSLSVFSVLVGSLVGFRTSNPSLATLSILRPSSMYQLITRRGRFRALAVRDEARKKEWQRSEFSHGSERKFRAPQQGVGSNPALSNQ